MSEKWKFRATDFVLSGGVTPSYQDMAYSANAKLQEWIAESPTVFGWDHRAGFVYQGQKVDQDLHWQGLIIKIEPIVKDTMESLLRELVMNALPSRNQSNDRQYLQMLDAEGFYERARKLLEGK